MLEAKLNTNELGLKASLATTLSYGGRVKIKKRSNKYVDDTLHAEDAPTTVRQLLVTAFSPYLLKTERETIFQLLPSLLDIIICINVSQFSHVYIWYIITIFLRSRIACMC
jgi:hypothetical protein